MIGSLSSHAIGAAAIAAALLVGGCSSPSDVPPTVASAPGGGTQQNTDTGSGGSFPDVNTTPTQRPTSTIQDLQLAPDGLSGAQNGTQYGETLVGGPTSSAAPPPPPPPPEPEQDLAPIPEPGLKTQTTDVAPAEPEPQPVQQAVEAEPAPAPTGGGEGQTIQGTMGDAQPEPEAVPEPEPQPEPEPAPVVEAPQQPVPEPEPAQVAEVPQPEPQSVEPAPAEPQPVAPVPQTSAPAFQPEAQAVSEPSAVQTSALSAAQPQLAPSAYGPNNNRAPDAYGISVPQPAAPAYGASPVVMAPPAAPAYGAYPNPYRGGGQPVGLIYFRDGSSTLSSDDRNVVQQIAEVHRARGGVVYVIGHASMGTSSTDYVRYQEANQRISEARAMAVVEELLRYGVPEDAIQWTGVGSSQPLYTEAMPNGEAANRRVDVYLSAY